MMDDATRAADALFAEFVKHHRCAGMGGEALRVRDALARSCAENEEFRLDGAARCLLDWSAICAAAAVRLTREKMEKRT